MIDIAELIAALQAALARDPGAEFCLMRTKHVAELLELLKAADE